MNPTFSRALLVLTAAAGLAVAQDAAPAPAPSPAVVSPNVKGDQSGLETLQRAVEAIRAAKGLRYTGKVYGVGGMLADVSPAAEGEVAMLRHSDGRWMIRATGTGSPKPKDPAKPFDVAWLQPPAIRYTDADAKQVIQRPARTVSNPTVRAADAIRLAELVADEPFKEQLAAANIALEPQAEVDGVVCDVVTIWGGRGAKSRYHFGAADRLPRKAERLFEGNTVNGAYVVELTNIRVAEDLDPAFFAYPVPAGFTEDKIEPQTRDASEARPEPKQVRTDATPAAPAGAAAAPAAMMAQDFELARPSGEKVTLTSMRGSVVILDFWGTWCLPCRASHKELQTYHESLKNSPVKIVSLSVKEKTKEAPVEYMKRNNYTFDLLIEADTVADTYGVDVFPTFIVVGKNGEIVHREEGFTREETIASLRKAVESYLAEQPS